MADPTTYEKHTTHTDALDSLGSIIGPGEKRDAIHLAVYPVAAGEFLEIGEDVRLGDDGCAYRSRPNAGVGIVDPFLTVAPRIGERFWLVVYPRQISSLRHVWEHPAFPPSAVPAEIFGYPRQDVTWTASAAPDAADQEVDPYSAAASKAASEAWLRAWCEASDCPEFDAVVAVIRDGSWTPAGEDADWCSGQMSDWGPYIRFRGVDAHSSIPAEFWDHMEVYLDRKFDDDERPEGFSCSC